MGQDSFLKKRNDNKIVIKELVLEFKNEVAMAAFFWLSYWGHIFSISTIYKLTEERDKNVINI